MATPKPIANNSGDRLVPVMQAWLEQGVDDFDLLLASSQIHQAVKVVDANLDAVLRPYNITMPRFSILTRLYWSDGEMMLGEIANVLRLHPTTVTSAVDRLARDELIERVPHATDRRVTLARITPKGRKLVDESLPKITEQQFGMPGADADLLRRLCLLLREVREAAGDVVAGEAEYLDYMTRGERKRPRASRLRRGRALR